VILIPQLLAKNPLYPADLCSGITADRSRPDVQAIMLGLCVGAFLRSLAENFKGRFCFIYPKNAGVGVYCNRAVVSISWHRITEIGTERGLLAGNKGAIVDVMGNPSALRSFPDQASAHPPNTIVA
jgi:hypothetical protein